MPAKDEGIERYRPRAIPNGVPPPMERAGSGPWVRYSDYHAEREQREAAEGERDKLRDEQREAVARDIEAGRLSPTPKEER